MKKYIVAFSLLSLTVCSPIFLLASPINELKISIENKIDVKDFNGITVGGPIQVIVGFG